ncbi:MAG TPA: NACHT domain-containing protein [Ktedonobacteraceae bacterium]
MKRKPPFFTLVLIVLTVLIGAASGPIGNAIELPSSVKPFALPLFICLAFILSLIALSQYFLQQEQTPVPVSPISQQNRERLIARVRQFWITGVLDQSLHGAALIALGLQNEPDMLANPWRLVLQQQNQPAHPLPEGTRIPQVYDEALGELLILGEPGCGKTTLLLELARDLLYRAEQDEHLPIPMVFPLSSWAVKRQPLAEWLVEEMKTKYQIQRRLAQGWVSAGLILPLLDGLDEVAALYRDACLGCINSFRQEYDGLVSMVVCSRSGDYLDLKQRLLLDYAVIVQPLTDQQIDEYLSSAGEQMRSVRTVLKHDRVLREMATTPLLLSVMTLAYQRSASKSVAVAESLGKRRERLFDDYVNTMLGRRSPETRYTAQQTVSWLSWLAQQMMEYGQTEFFLERLQPDWLSETRSHFVYFFVVVLSIGLLVGLPNWLLFGPLLGLRVGPLLGLLLGLLVGLFFGLEGEIRPAEFISWTRQSIERGLLVGLFISVVVGLVMALFNGPLGGSFIGLFTGMMSGIIAGLSGEMLETRHLDKPNRGIWRSARYAVVFWLLFALFGALLAGLVGALLYGLLAGLLAGLFSGLIGGLIAGLTLGLFFGGGACIKHFILRWFLWRAGYMPWNYARFLDYATERIFLRKVAGGYSFVHRLLLEYFANRTGRSLVDGKKAAVGH